MASGGPVAVRWRFCEASAALERVKQECIRRGLVDGLAAYPTGRLKRRKGRRLPTGGLKRRFFLLARLCRPALSCSGGICCSRLLRLIFLHESISLLSHASPRRFVRCTDVEIGMAEGYVTLALLKQRRVVPDSLAIGSYPSHFWLTRHAAKIHAERGDHANG